MRLLGFSNRFLFLEINKEFVIGGCGVLGPIFGIACITCITLVFCCHMVLVMVLSTKRGNYYVGLCGHARAMIYRSTCQLSHCQGFVFILLTG